MGSRGKDHTCLACVPGKFWQRSPVWNRPREQRILKAVWIWKESLISMYMEEDGNFCVDSFWASICIRNDKCYQI